MSPAAITSSLAAPCVPRIHISDRVLDTIQTLLDRHACGVGGPKLMRLARKLGTAQISASTGIPAPADRRLRDAS
jgi:hypothetical protein